MSKEDKDVHLPWGRILIIGFIPMVLIFIGFFMAVKYIGVDNYSWIVNYVDEHFGLLCIFLYVYIVDLFIMPLSPDFVFPIVAGMEWYKIIPIIGTASALGGVTGYCVGRLLDKIPAIARVSAKAEAKWGAYIKKYGVVFVILAALLPIPFSTVCIATGVMRVDASKVIPACFFRVLRMGIFFFLFKAGLVLV